MQLRVVPFVLEVLYANMSKRNVFAELTEGFDALAAALKGKITLRATEVELKPTLEVNAEELRAIREKINLSAVGRSSAV